jgi:hypothetical protein
MMDDWSYLNCKAYFSSLEDESLGLEEVTSLEEVYEEDPCSCKDFISPLLLSSSSSTSLS